MDPKATTDSDTMRPILVTGASSGIGRNIAETLAANGYYVYAGARKQVDLDAPVPAAAAVHAAAGRDVKLVDQEVVRPVVEAHPPLVGGVEIRGAIGEGVLARVVDGEQVVAVGVAVGPGVLPVLVGLAEQVGGGAIGVAVAGAGGALVHGAIAVVVDAVAVL